MIVQNLRLLLGWHICILLWFINALAVDAMKLFIPLKTYYCQDRAVRTVISYIIHLANGGKYASTFQNPKSVLLPVTDSLLTAQGRKEQNLGYGPSG
ncbi:hypothetical protein V1505DRAFT_372567 [Lipomyces doorenjongii]